SPDVGGDLPQRQPVARSPRALGLAPRRDDMILAVDTDIFWDIIATAREQSGPGQPFHQARLHGFRRLMAVYWLLMLLPGSPAHRRNPPGSLERQAVHVCQLL